MEKINFETIFNALVSESDNCSTKHTSVEKIVNTTPLFDNLVELMFKYLPKDRSGAECLYGLTRNDRLKEYIGIDRIASEMLKYKDAIYYINKLTQRYSNLIDSETLEKLIKHIRCLSTASDFFEVYDHLCRANQRLYKKDMVSSIIVGKDCDLALRFCRRLSDDIKDIDNDADIQRLSNLILDHSDCVYSLDFVENFGCENETFNKHARRILEKDISKLYLVSLLCNYPYCGIYGELYEGLFNGEPNNANIRFLRNISAHKISDLDRHSKYIASANSPSLSYSFIDVKEGYDLKLHGDIIMNGIEEDTKDLLKKSSYYSRYYMQTILEKLEQNPEIEIEIDVQA